MKHKINKKVLLEEGLGESLTASGDIIRGGLQRFVGVNYDKKDGYNTEANGRVTYNSKNNTGPTEVQNDRASAPEQSDQSDQFAN